MPAINRIHICGFKAFPNDFELQLEGKMGAAWALENKRVLPFVLPNTKFKDMGFLNVVKQGASIADKSKLDEFYKEVCEYYAISSDWLSFNKAKEDFIGITTK